MQQRVDQIVGKVSNECTLFCWRVDIISSTRSAIWIWTYHQVPFSNILSSGNYLWGSIQFITFGLCRQYKFLELTFKAIMGNDEVIKIHYLSDNVPKAAGLMDQTVQGRVVIIRVSLPGRFERLKSWNSEIGVWYFSTLHSSLQQ